MSDTPFETIPIRCGKDGEPLIVVTGPEFGGLAVCPICGAGGKLETVAKQSAGIEPSVLSEKQLVNLREQIRIARDKRR